MTKRTLFIIIGLLVFLDVAALLIYLVSNSNRDGKSPLELTFDEDRIVLPADTIPSIVNEDRFDTIERKITYVSSDKIMVDGQSKGMLSSIRVKMAWPASINKSSSLTDLEHALIKKLLGVNTEVTNMQECVERLISTPRFVKPSTHYVAGQYSEPTGAPHHSHYNYRVFPMVGTASLLEMMVMIDSFDGTASHSEIKVVHYDRMHNKVLTINNIFNLSHSNDILALVNQGIEHLKTIKKNKTIHEIGFLPDEFLLGSKSVIFFMRDGLIASPGTGLYEVYVPNDDLISYFTEYYQELYNNDTQFKKYGFLPL